MAIPKTTSNPTRDLKQRVIVSLNKLADRDTAAGATAELESIARNLTPDSLSAFLSCIYSGDDGDRAAVRRQCVRLLGVLSHSHGDALAPFLSKMLAAVVRRLRDPDSAVRSACVNAVAAMSSRITRPPFSAFLKPLADAVVHQQDQSAQIGSAMCLAAAIEASPELEPAHLAKLLPKLLKLVRSEGFRAKPALISLVGSVVGAGGASNRNVLDSLIPCLVEHLSSEDWAARKAAAEALGRVAVVERDLVVELRSKCLASLETRRFDKVKGVREIMNRTLELWKEVPDVADEALPLSQAKSSKDNVRDASAPVNKSSRDFGFIAPYDAKVIPPTSLSLDDSSATTSPPLQSNVKKSGTSMFQKLDCKRSSNWKIEIPVPNSPSSNVTREDDLKTSFKVLEPRESRSRNLRPETKRALFNKVSDEKGHKFGGPRSGSRVVPFHESDNSDLAILDSSFTDEAHGNHRDVEDLSLIQKQLVQIENQQSSLLNLLQKFIGSSQSGMNSLETRVNGLERALDEISYDLAISSGKIANTDYVGNTCCKLPGTEFLSSKFWRRTEARYPASTGTIQSMATTHSMPDKDASSETLNLEGEILQHQNAARFVVNPSPDICRDSRMKTGVNLNGAEKNIIQSAMNVNSRSSA